MKVNVNRAKKEQQIKEIHESFVKYDSFYLLDFMEYFDTIHIVHFDIA